MTKKNASKIFLLTSMSIFCFGFLLSFIWLPHNPNVVYNNHILEAPSSLFWFGTDSLGRDLFSRMLIGTQSLFTIAFSSLILSALIGVSLGLLTGYTQKWWTEIIHKMIDGWMALPGILIVLCFVAVFSYGLLQTLLAISLINFTSFSKITRAKTLELREKNEITWGKMNGMSHWRILIHLILPELLPTLSTLVALRFSTAVLIESGLSYLGLGIQEPMASWGNILSRAQPYINTHPWYALIPTLFLTWLVLSSNLAADFLQKEVFYAKD